MKQLVKTVTTWVGIALLLVHNVWAQSDDIAEAFRKPTALEEQRLRALLASPVPPGPIYQRQSFFYEKHAAAVGLGDEVQAEAILREAMRTAPSEHFKFRLSRILLQKGQTAEGNDMASQAVAAANPFVAPIYLAATACDMFSQNKDDAAKRVVTTVMDRIKTAERIAFDDLAKINLFKAARTAMHCLSFVEERAGRVERMVAAAEAAEVQGRKTLSLLTGQSQDVALHTRNDVARSIERRLTAYRLAGRLEDAEKSLADFVRY